VLHLAVLNILRMQEVLLKKNTKMGKLLRKNQEVGKVAIHVEDHPDVNL
jgi:hypothetical protein